MLQVDYPGVELGGDVGHDEDHQHAGHRHHHHHALQVPAAEAGHQPPGARPPATLIIQGFRGRDWMRPVGVTVSLPPVLRI